MLTSTTEHPPRGRNNRVVSHAFSTVSRDPDATGNAACGTPQASAIRCMISASGVGPLDPGGECRGAKAVNIAVEHGTRIPCFDAGAEVLYHLIGLQHVGPDLVAPADFGLGCVHRAAKS